MIYWLSVWMDEMPSDDEGISPSFLSESERTVYGGLRLPKRRREWLLGRWTAKRLLQRSLDGYAGLSLHEISVIGDPDGAPCYWVDGRRLSLSLSLAHRAGRAVAALSDTHTVGVDVERVERRAPVLVEDFFTPSEAAAVHAAPEADRDRLVTLIWSAKEAALKVLREGLRMDTRKVEVSGLTLPADPSSWHPLHIRCVLPHAPRLAAWWRPDGDDVLTLAISSETGAQPEIRAV